MFYTLEATIHPRKQIPISGNLHRLLDFDKRDNKHQYHEVIQMVQETYTELINDHKQIIITWIPSHQGREGNEKADSSTKEATTDRTNEQPTSQSHTKTY